MKAPMVGCFFDSNQLGYCIRTNLFAQLRKEHRLHQAETRSAKSFRELVQKPAANKKPMEKQHPRQITGFETPNNNAADPSFKKKLD
jgi:hypothetical protein